MNINKTTGIKIETLKEGDGIVYFLYLKINLILK